MDVLEGYGMCHGKGLLLCLSLQGVSLYSFAPPPHTTGVQLDREYWYVPYLHLPFWPLFNSIWLLFCHFNPFCQHLLDFSAPVPPYTNLAPMHPSSIDLYINCHSFGPLFITIFVFFYTPVLSYINLVSQLQQTWSILTYLKSLSHYILVFPCTYANLDWSGPYIVSISWRNLSLVPIYNNLINLFENGLVLTPNLAPFDQAHNMISRRP